MMGESELVKVEQPQGSNTSLDIDQDQLPLQQVQEETKMQTQIRTKTQMTMNPHTPAEPADGVHFGVEHGLLDGQLEVGSSVSMPIFYGWRLTTWVMHMMCKMEGNRPINAPGL